MRKLGFVVVHTMLAAAVVAGSSAAIAQQAAAPVAPPVVAAVPPPPPPPVPVDPRVTLAGNYNFAGGSRDRGLVDAAIERAVSPMFFAIRPIARGRLHDINPIYNSVTIRFANGVVEVNLAGSPLMRSNEGARTPWTARNGDHVQMTQRLDGNGHLIQELAGETGTRRNEFIASPDGHTLTLRVRITSTQLSSPMAYELTYRR